MANWADLTIPDALAELAGLVNLTSASDLTASEENSQPVALDANTDILLTAESALITLANLLPSYFLSTDGSTNSSMRSQLDLDSNRIQNLDDAVNGKDLITYSQYSTVTVGTDSLSDFVGIGTGNQTVVLKSGGADSAMTGNLNLGIQRIVNVSDPVDSGDAVTRGWCDTAFLLDDTFQSRLYADTKIRSGVLNMAGYKVGKVENAEEPADVANMQDFIDEMNRQNLGNSTEPEGVIRAYAGTGISPPTGYLWCDGAEYADEDYPRLSAPACLGYRYGSSTGGRFKVPDIRGRFLAGLDDLNGSDSAGVLTRSEASGYHTGAQGPKSTNNFGEVDVTLSEGEMASHTHAFKNGRYVNATTGVPYSPVTAGNAGSVSTWDNDSTENAWGTEGTGGSFAHENMPPVMVIRWIICIG